MLTSKENLVKIAFAVTLVLLTYVFLKLDLKELLKILAGIKFPLFSAALLTLISELLLKALRLKILIGPEGKSSIGDNLMVTLIGLPFGTITPGRIGDLAKTYTLSKKSGARMAKSLAIVVMEKDLDFSAL